jgi:hypothetical protein
MRRWALLSIAPLVAACAAGAVRTVDAPRSESKAPISPLARLFPLSDGTIWTYDAMDEQTKAPGMFVMRARRLGPTTFELRTGSRTRVVELRADGIARADTGAYLIKGPVSVGTKWSGEGGAIVRINAIDREVRVPAGQFFGCVETTEETANAPGGPPLKRVTTTYCPDVGIATLRVQMWQGAEAASEHATLRSWGAPIDVGGGRPDQAR